MSNVIKSKNVWLALLMLVLASNYMIYNTALGVKILPAETTAVVLGSLLDLVVIMPVLFMLYKRKFSVKQAILLAAAGCILARFIIPMEHLKPFVAVTWVGFAVEGVLLLVEILLIVTLVRFMPHIVREVRNSSLPKLFSFPAAVEKNVKNLPIIQVICSEFLIFYYAFASWKKPVRNGITLHKNSSYIAFQVMMIHAIVIETLGLHWWLHEKSMILSIILLVLNIYSVFFFLADIQAVRLNPIHVTEEKVYVSLGLMKRVEIPFADIEAIVTEKEVLEQKLSKNTLDFVARDFETTFPNLIIEMKKPVKATFMMGIQKEYKKIAIKADQANELIAIFSSRLQ
ncbi:MAG: beta-carotene 15,15'-monooxygenase [Lysinibacillus sp.]